MATAKLLLLLVAVTAQLYAVTAPTVRPPTEELREQRGAERVVSYFTVFVRTLIWSWAFFEGSVLFALCGHCPPALARPPFHAIYTSLPTLTPAFVAGALLSIAGALLRAHCFRALGACFTFELSIRPSHTLVTDGVYGVVRHPSYTGAIALAVGWFLCVLDRRGSVVSACGAWAQVPSASDGRGGANGGRIVMGVLACLWTTALALMSVAVSKRMNKEDAMLEKNFGEEWRAWARRVPYRLIPGVY